MAKRKQRIDGVAAQVEVMQAALGIITSPAHIPLVEQDYPFWHSIIAEKAKAEWTAHDLEIAALLSQSLRKLRDEEAKLDIEDYVVTTTSGNLAQNPRVRIVADLHGRAMKYRQTLGIHSRGKNGEKRDVDKRRLQSFEVESDNPLDDDLLARPTVN